MSKTGTIIGATACIAGIALMPYMPVGVTVATAAKVATVVKGAQILGLCALGIGAVGTYLKHRDNNQENLSCYSDYGVEPSQENQTKAEVEEASEIVNSDVYFQSSNQTSESISYRPNREQEL